MPVAEVVVMRRELSAALVCLALVVIGAYANVVFQGRSLVSTDNMNPLDYRPSAEAYGPGFVPHEVWARRNLLLFANLHDPGGSWWQWEPAAEFLRRGLWRGELPWWDPYVGAGVPAMANVTSTSFFPPHLAVILLGNSSLLQNVYSLGLVLCAGFFTFLFLRRHEVSWHASMFAGIAYMMSGAIAQTVGSFIGQLTACLPLVLWVTKLLVDQPSARRVWLTAVTYAAVSLASFPPLLVAVFGLAVFYAGAGILGPDRRQPRERLQLAIRFAAAVLLALGLSAFAWLPFVHLAAFCDQLRSHYAGAGLQAVPVAGLYQLWSPVLMGAAKIHSLPAVSLRPAPELSYVGAVALIAATLTWRRTPGSQRFLLAWAGVAAALLALKLVGAEPIQSLGQLPLLRNIHMAHYFGMPLAFLLAVIAGLGFERLVQGTVTPARALITVATVGLVLGTMWQVAVARGALQAVAAAGWRKEWILSAAISGATLLAVVGSAFLRNRTAGRLIPLSLVTALLLAEGFHNTFYPRQQAWNVWRHPVPYVRKIEAEAGFGRVVGFAVFNANAGSAFEVFQLDSLMAFNSPRVFAFYKRYFAPHSYSFLREAERLPEEGVLDAANIELVAVRGVFADRRDEARRRGYRSLYDDGYAEIFRRWSPPRYFFTSDYRVAPPEDALESLPGLVPKAIVLESQPGFASSSNDSRDPKVEVEAFRRNRFRLRVDAPRPGLVYCSESQMPGWRAFVNGRPTKILSANYAFRAIEVPQGQAIIDFEYLPPGLVPGLIVSGLSFTLLAGWWISTRVAGRRQAGQKV